MSSIVHAMYVARHKNSLHALFTIVSCLGHLKYPIPKAVRDLFLDVFKANGWASTMICIAYSWPINQLDLGATDHVPANVTDDLYHATWNWLRARKLHHLEQKHSKNLFFHKAFRVAADMYHRTQVKDWKEAALCVGKILATKIDPNDDASWLPTIIDSISIFVDPFANFELILDINSLSLGMKCYRNKETKSLMIKFLYCRSCITDEISRIASCINDTKPPSIDIFVMSPHLVSSIGSILYLVGKELQVIIGSGSAHVFGYLSSSSNYRDFVLGKFRTHVLHHVSNENALVWNMPEPINGAPHIIGTTSLECKPELLNLVQDNTQSLINMLISLPFIPSVSSEFNLHYESFIEIYLLTGQWMN